MYRHGRIDFNSRRQRREFPIAVLRPSRLRIFALQFKIPRRVKREDARTLRSIPNEADRTDCATARLVGAIFWETKPRERLRQEQPIAVFGRSRLRIFALQFKIPTRVKREDAKVRM